MIRYTKDHEWLRADGEIVVVGITRHAQEQLGDLVFIEFPAAGRPVEPGAVAAIVESVKAASEVYAPISGVVLEVNSAVVEKPALVNLDPEGSGWLFKMKSTNPVEMEDLLDEEAYKAQIA